MPHVFISYSHKDHEQAQILNGELLSAKIETYLDNQQLQAGRPFRPELRQAIDSSYAVVVICTVTSMASSEVLFELAYALGRRLPVIPIKLETKCRIPPFLAEYPWLDFSRSRNWAELVLKIRNLPVFPWSPDGWHRVGLQEIGSGRPQRKRLDYIYNVLDTIQPESKLIIVGRSLTEWADVAEGLQTAINEKRIEVKLGLLDENSLTEVNHRLSSWIDAPIPRDWAMRDVHRSMDRFRKIEVRQHTGSLSVYGLPFYASHSFVAHTRGDGTRQCLQEAGMAAPSVSRPYLVVTTPPNSPPNTFGALLEQMNEGVMTAERLLLSNDGNRRLQDTTHRGRVLADKVKRLGLMDICASRDDREWLTGSVGTLIDDTPDGGEIFVIGRSLVAWSTEHPRLIRAVAERAVRCTFAIADPTAEPKLKSLVKGDYAEVDLVSCWTNFLQAAEDLKKLPTCRGTFQAYGLPAYIPETFASYENSAVKYCMLETGIGFGPERRPSMYFANVSDHDVYSNLNRIFRAILVDRQPLIKVP